MGSRLSRLFANTCHTPLLNQLAPGTRLRSDSGPEASTRSSQFNRPGTGLAAAGTTLNSMTRPAPSW